VAVTYTDLADIEVGFPGVAYYDPTILAAYDDRDAVAFVAARGYALLRRDGDTLTAPFQAALPGGFSTGPQNSWTLRRQTADRIVAMGGQDGVSVTGANSLPIGRIERTGDTLTATNLGAFSVFVGEGNWVGRGEPLLVNDTQAIAYLARRGESGYHELRYHIVTMTDPPSTGASRFDRFYSYRTLVNGNPPDIDLPTVLAVHETFPQVGVNALNTVRQLTLVGPWNATFEQFTHVRDSPGRAAPMSAYLWNSVGGSSGLLDHQQLSPTANYPDRRSVRLIATAPGSLAVVMREWDPATSGDLLTVRGITDAGGDSYGQLTITAPLALPGTRQYDLSIIPAATSHAPGRVTVHGQTNRGRYEIDITTDPPTIVHTEDYQNGWFPVALSATHGILVAVGENKLLARLYGRAGDEPPPPPLPSPSSAQFTSRRVRFPGR